MTSMPHVLIVDDDADFLAGVLRILGSHGFVVEGASSGSEALARLTTRRFDVVLSDVQMPGLTGIDLMSAIRQRDLDVPVVLMTGDPTLGTAILAIEEGAVAYLTKPVSRHKLIPAIEKAAQLGAFSAARRAAAGLLANVGGFSGDKAGLRVVFERALAGVRPVYQPIVDVTDRRVCSFEALLRTGERMLPGPGDVLAAAERLGRVHDLGRVVRAAVAIDAASLPENTDLYVNLHPVDLLDPELFDRASPLAAHATRTVLEITERATLDHVSDVEGRATKLRLMGYRLALDDLGAGYAGLTSLVQLQPDVVKLDMSLVRNVDLDEGRQRVVGAMIDLADRLQMKMIAEGVETAGESQWLSLVGCRLQQGYYFARPAPPFPAARFDATP